MNLKDDREPVVANKEVYWSVLLYHNSLFGLFKVCKSGTFLLT